MCTVYYYKFKQLYLLAIGLATGEKGQLVATVLQSKGFVKHTGANAVYNPYRYRHSKEGNSVYFPRDSRRI